MIEMCAVFDVFVRLAVVQSCVLHVHFSTDSICKVEVLIVVTHSSTVCWVIKQKSTYCGFFKKYTCTCSLSLYVVVVLLCFMCTCIILIYCELLYPLLFGLSCTCITCCDEVFPFTVASASQHMCKYGCVQTALFGLTVC